MRIREISMAAFGPYDEAILDLPESGVVLITGPNGSGKSTFVQAVSHAVWGKALVGDLMWRDLRGAGKNARSMASITLDDGMTIERWQTSRGSKQLRWGGGERHPTTSKAQTDLETVVGPMQLWRWSSMFMNDAPDVFPRATDRNRKRLVEEVLVPGDRFDAALRRTRGELKTLTAEQVDLERRAESLRFGAQQARSALEAAEPFSPGRGEVDAAVRAVEDARREFSDLDEICGEVEKNLRDATYTPGSDDAEVQTLTAKLRTMRDVCPTCGSKLDPGDVGAVRRRLCELRSVVDARRVECERRCAKIRKMRDKSVEVRDRASTVLHEAVDDLSRLRGAEKVHSQWLERTVEQRRTADENDAKAARLEASSRAVSSRISLLRAAEKVFGLRGARARVTGRALSAIELGANRWLSRLGGDGWAVRLRAYSELKNGKQEEQISLQVQAPDVTQEVIRRGGSEWRSYWSTSAGQRRRFDLAVMLGIGDVVRDLAGGGCSTMFFDEALGALDDDGKRRAVDVVHELSKRTCVVVVDHDDAIVDRLRPVKHLHIEEGVVR